jgi:hypothetical protein
MIPLDLDQDKGALDILKQEKQEKGRREREEAERRGSRTGGSAHGRIGQEAQDRSASPKPYL